jgi:anti-sigma factor RsiW
MHEVSERFERLITRHLDGELTSEERNELDRELLRNPAVREMMEAYTAIDAVAAKVVADCAARGSGPHLELTGSGPMMQAHAPRRHWMLWASGLAACLALVILWRTPPAPPDSTPTAGGQVPAAAGQQLSPVRSLRPVPVVGAPGEEAGVWPVVHQSPPEVDRVTDRNVLFLTDEAGNVYMINVDHVREVQKPTNRSGIHYTRDPI